MDDKKREETLRKIQELSEEVKSRLDENLQNIEEIIYLEDFQFGKSGLGENNVYIVEILNENENVVEDKSKSDFKDGLEKYKTYEIYNEENNLIATVEKEGKIQFNEKYLQSLREKYKEYFNELDLYDIDFELPRELQENDLVMTKEDIAEYKGREGKEGGNTEKKVEEEEQDLDKKQEEQIAESKGIPAQNVLKIRENSNFYYDHPELEENLYFYKGEDGIIRAEYLDENGNSQPSKFFEESQTALRQETVAMGDDGNPVQKKVPYQVMQTKNLSGTDKDIRDIRINVNIDTYGYLEISEARQGMNGMWASHDIEVRGRDYNSYDLNKETSIRTRKADPDKHTDSYEKVEGTELVEDGVQYHEMYLMEHADEIIQEFIDEGYNKDEATDIFNLMIGEENLKEEEAKIRVNDQIREREEKEQEQGNDSRSIEDDDEGRTPWGDAEDRRYR